MRALRLLTPHQLALLFLIAHSLSFPFLQTVEFHLIGDWMKSVAHLMPDLLNNYKVLVYNGQLDIILGVALGEKFYRTIPWLGQAEYLAASRAIWKAPSETTIAGYVRSVRNFR